MLLEDESSRHGTHKIACASRVYSWVNRTKARRLAWAFNAHALSRFLYLFNFKTIHDLLKQIESEPITRFFSHGYVVDTKMTPCHEGPR